MTVRRPFRELYFRNQRELRFAAREAAAAALTQAILSDREDLALKLHGSFRGFEILNRGRPGRIVFASDEEALPELFIRGDFTGRKSASLSHIEKKDPVTSPIDKPI
jgi:hypothetical protein